VVSQRLSLQKPCGIRDTSSQIRYPPFSIVNKLNLLKIATQLTSFKPLQRKRPARVNQRIRVSAIQRP